MTRASVLVAFLAALALAAPGGAALRAKPGAGLTFVQVTGGGEVGGAAAFTVWTTTAGGRRKIAAGAGPLAWSPDGRHLLFTRLGAQGYTLLVSAPDGKGVRAVAARTSTGSWLANSHTVAYARLVRANRYAVYRVDLDRKVRKKLFVLPGVPVWSPDGQSLVYARGGELMLARGDASHARPLARGSSLVSWSPDGRDVAFERGHKICVTRVSSRATHCFAPAAGGAAPTWSPDGSQLVYARGDGFAIASARPDGRGQHDLLAISTAATRLETPVWRP